MTPDPDAVRISALCVVRGGREVLHDVSLRLRRARITGLLGPSGCGKTTLLRCLVGVQRIATGDVEVLGQPAGVASLRRRVAYTTQMPAVYGDLSVRENLRYFARVLGAPSAAVGVALTTVGLEESAGAVVARLSGGQRARVSLASALLGDPELLVLDEPTVGLDPVLRRDLWRTFRHLADGGAALIVSSHVLDEADRCDDLVLMRDGRILASDTPAELCRRTGVSRVEDAFLALVDAQQTA